MAGIGFELQKITNNHSLINFIRAHLYAGALSSGSWIISIAILISIYFYMERYFGHASFCIQFLVAVTYLISSSLVLSSIFYQALVSYVADRIFEHRYKLIIPALFTASLVLMIMSAGLGYISVVLFLSKQPLPLQWLMGNSFVVLNLIWLYTNTLSGLKNYKFILGSYVICYVVIFLLAIYLYQFQLIGLLLAFFIGHVLLLTGFIIFTLRNYPMNQFIRWDVFYYMNKHKLLIIGGVFFQLGIWVDKYCFWLNPNTRVAILGDLQASPIYDMPMFIAFVFLIPGISMLFYDVETHFSQYYQIYFDAIRDGGTLREINEKRIELVSMSRTCFLNALKVQVFISAISAIFAQELLAAIGLSSAYIYLLRIDLLSSCFFIALLAQISFLYHFKKHLEIAYVTVIFFLLSLILTLFTFHLGPWYYGYGFALALFISNLICFYYLNSCYKKLTYYSFMSIGMEDS